MKQWVAMAVATGMVSGGLSYGAVTLVENGQSAAVLVLPDQPMDREAAAAKELQAYLKRISGAELPIVPPGDAAPGKARVLIGRACPPDVMQAIRAKTDNPDALAVFAGNNRVCLTGILTDDDAAAERKAKAEDAALIAARKKRAPKETPPALEGGVAFAVEELLEQLGVRWFMPGEIGTVVPQMKTVRVEDQQTLQVPSLRSRQLQAVGDRDPEATLWENHMRIGGPRFPSSHGAPGLEPTATLFKDHPEYGSLVNGKRSSKQLCVSNPGVIAEVVKATKEHFRANPGSPWIGMGANDGRGFCECPNCKALDGGDYDPFGHFESMTDRYVWFFNQVLKGIEDEFPDKQIAFYAYSVYNRPPVKVKPDKRIVPAVALITLCRFHGTGTPSCPEKDYERWVISEWCKLVPQVYWRGYWFNLADPGLPYFFVERVRKEIPAYKQAGLVGIRSESPPNWAGGGVPSLYIACKLMWDDKADVDALMTDFYAKFFGPAAAPMRRYVEAIEMAREKGDFHTGSSWDCPAMYGPEVRKTAREALAQAKALAAQEPYALRVAGFEKEWQAMEEFAAMLEKRAVHDYAGSAAALAQMRTLLTDLQKPIVYGASDARQPTSWIPGRHKALEYLDRFFSQPTSDGAAKVTNGNTFVAGLNDTWDFLIDPEQIGVVVKFFDPAFTGGNWQKLRTSSTSWSTQGLRYYKGWAWYRQTVQVPESFKGRKVFLWIGGVDEKATVWINGKPVGNTAKGTFKACDLDATAALNFGGANMVAILLQNMAIQEIGCGGITGPVMFYAPADPEAKPTGVAFEIPVPTPMVPLAAAVPAAVTQPAKDDKPQDMETIAEGDKAGGKAKE